MPIIEWSSIDLIPAFVTYLQMNWSQSKTIAETAEEISHKVIVISFNLIQSTRKHTETQEFLLLFRALVVMFQIFRIFVLRLLNLGKILLLIVIAFQCMYYSVTHSLFDGTMLNTVDTFKTNTNAIIIIIPWESKKKKWNTCCCSQILFVSYSIFSNIAFG